MSRKKKKSGFSLVEIMVAMLLLLVLVIAGAMVLYTTGADVQVYGNKRVALELARTQLEALLAQDYDALRTAAVAGSPQTGSRSETWNDIPIAINWTNELISSGGVVWQYTGGALDNEYIKLDVAASFPGTDDAVLLQATKTDTP